MIVKSCRRCPFFTTTMLSLLASSKGGECTYRKADDSLAIMDMTTPEGTDREEMRTRVAQRLRVTDASLIPGACPLHDRDIVVTLGVN